MRFGGAALIALVATGCASVDQEVLDAQLPTVPTQWEAGALLEQPVDGVPTGDWVAAFDDPQLPQLIKEAIANNNNFQRAAANLAIARAGFQSSRARLLPSIDVSADGRRDAVLNLDPSNDDRRVYSNGFSLGALLNWELDLWGRLTDEAGAALKDSRAAYADYAGAELSLAGAVAQSWFGLIEARQQRELAQRDVTARQSNLRVTERRYERGVASSLDVRLARSALGSSDANLALRQQLEKELSRSLEVLLGRYPAAELDAAAALPSLPLLDGAGAPSDILTRRPDLVAAEKRMESAGLLARAAKKQFLPTLRLSSAVSANGTELGDIVDPERVIGNIAGGILQPVFRGGALIANSKRASASAEAALYGYVETVLRAFEEAENAIAAERFLALREDALRIAFEEAAASEEITERRYANGTESIFNLLNAQTRRISAESQYILAQQQRVSNRVQLYLAIGGDFLTEERVTAHTLTK